MIITKIIALEEPFDDPELEVEQTSTVAELKSEISSWWNTVPPKEQLLFYYKQILDDDRTLGSYGIGEGSKIQLVTLAPGRMAITLKTATKTVPLRVCKVDTISNVKQQLLQKGINTTGYSIKLGGRVLDDNATIEQLQITSRAQLAL